MDLHSAHHVVHGLGYVGVFVTLLLEAVGLPLPADTTLAVAGAAWTNGKMLLAPLLLWAVLGNIIGSSIAYWIGRTAGRPIILKFGKYVGITAKEMDKADTAFKKRQVLILLLAKFIMGIRVFAPYLAGMNKVKFSTFSLYNSIGAIAWACVFVFLGKPIDKVWLKYKAVLQPYLWPVLAVVVVLIVWKIWRKHKSMGNS